MSTRPISRKSTALRQTTQDGQGADGRQVRQYSGDLPASGRRRLSSSSRNTRPLTICTLISTSRASSRNGSLRERKMRTPPALAGACVIVIDHLARVQNREPRELQAYAKKRVIGGVSLKATVQTGYAPGHGGKTLLTVEGPERRTEAVLSHRRKNRTRGSSVRADPDRWLERCSPQGRPT